MARTKQTASEKPRLAIVEVACSCCDGELPRVRVISTHRTKAAARSALARLAAEQHGVAAWGVGHGGFVVDREANNYNGMIQLEISLVQLPAPNA